MAREAPAERTKDYDLSLRMAAEALWGLSPARKLKPPAETITAARRDPSR